MPRQRQAKSGSANGVHRLGMRPGARMTAETGCGGSFREEKEEGPQGIRENGRTVFLVMQNLYLCVCLQSVLSNRIFTRTKASYLASMWG